MPSAVFVSDNVTVSSDVSSGTNSTATLPFNAASGTPVNVPATVATGASTALKLTSAVAELPVRVNLLASFVSSTLEPAFVITAI